MILVADCNHANPVDFERVAKTGLVGGIIHKATQGVSFADYLYSKRRELVAEAGLEWGAYDFSSDDDVRENVQRFLAVARPDARTGLWLDFERNPGHQMTIGQALEFLDRVDQAVGRRCGIYGGGDQLKPAMIGLTDAKREFLSQHPFWLCEYGPVAKMLDPNGHPLPWAKPDLWQKFADGVGPTPPIVDGLERKADLSIFDGDRAALAEWWPLPGIPTVGNTLVA